MIQQLRNSLAAAGLIAVLALAPPQVSGGFYQNIGIGLDALGFNVVGQHNFLSGGEDILINNTFVGNPLDFGIGDLTLQGPVSLQVSRGDRFLNTLDIDFSTAINRNVTASPLNYTLNVDVGPQETTISGSLLVDGSLSINEFGFYDLSMTYSSRQTVTNEGRFSNDTRTYDADFGPINVSGNIYADVLAVLTDPIFDATGTVNIFESFSGRTQLQNSLNEAASRVIAESGVTFDAADSPLPIAGIVVPEPPLVLMLLIGVPLLLSRRITALRRHS